MAIHGSSTGDAAVWPGAAPGNSDQALSIHALTPSASPPPASPASIVAIVTPIRNCIHAQPLPVPASAYQPLYPCTGAPLPSPLPVCMRPYPHPYPHMVTPNCVYSLTSGHPIQYAASSSQSRDRNGDQLYLSHSKAGLSLLSGLERGPEASSIHRASAENRPIYFETPHVCNAFTTRFPLLGLEDHVDCITVALCVLHHGCTSCCDFSWLLCVAQAIDAIDNASNSLQFDELGLRLWGFLTKDCKFQYYW